LSDQRGAGGRRVLTAPTTQDGTTLLVVDDFKTHFDTPGGMVKAVDGVTFSLDRGKTLGVVGESGSGKTVLARSIMGLLTARNVVRTGSATYAGQELVGAPNDQLRALWGTEMAMVFQDPMTALNPVMKIGRQITEGLRYHLEIPKDEATEQALQLLTSSRTRSGACRSTPTSCRAACASAW
jgi:peptide/nickel transport system ATP-binding protein